MLAREAGLHALERENRAALTAYAEAAQALDAAERSYREAFEALIVADKRAANSSTAYLAALSESTGAADERRRVLGKLRRVKA